MSDQQFGDWVNAHTIHTGGDPVRLKELLWANREIIVTRLNATYAELCECTDRLFEGGRVPQFPSEHPNALVKELRAIRAERAEREQTIANITAPHESVRGCDCPRCMPPNGSVKYQQTVARLKEWLKRNGEFGDAIFRRIPKR